MKRRAILLSACQDGTTTSDNSADLSAFACFLRSAYGGKWSADEIYQKENVRLDEAIAAIVSAKNADYSLVFFSGSGEIVKTELPWPEMQLTLASGEKASERDLNSGSPRCAMILDCSRMAAQPHKDQAAKQSISSPEACGRTGEFYDYYNKILTAAEGGLVKVYATPKSKENISASSFTAHLLNECQTWLKSNNGVLHFGNAIELANQATIRDGENCLVEYHGGRRLHDFPFAVKL